MTHMPLRASSRLPQIFIILTVLIDAIGIGLIFPVLPTLIREVTGRSLADAALWGGVLATGFAMMQFLFGPLIGNISDRFGRRPVLISALFVMTLDYLIMGWAQSIWLLLLGRIMAGISAATPGTAAAFMADVSKREDRARNFGYVHAAFGVGFALGPMIGGALAIFDIRAPFFAAALIAGLNMVFGLLVMPESLRPENRRTFTWRRANPLGAFRAIGELKGLTSLLAVFALYEVAYFVYPAVWSFFIEERYGFGTVMIGVTLFVFGITMGLAQAVFVGPLVKRFGAYRVAMGGIFLDCVVFLSFGLSANVPLMWIMNALSGVSAVSIPALQSMMSAATPDNQQGELQGVTGSLAALATILSPLMMTEAFAQFSRKDGGIYLPGAPFLLSLVILIIAGGLLWHWQRGISQSNRAELPSNASMR